MNMESKPKITTMTYDALFIIKIIYDPKVK
jgi:hypothetical protein